MTINEFKKALKKLTDEEFEKFKRDFGGSHTSREEYVRVYVHNPQHERRICQLLDLETQEETLTNASVISARTAQRATTCAAISAIAAVIGVVVAVLALFIAVGKQ